ncbi:V-type ATP synthase subunit A [Borreliella garinii]|uniref:V-type ATP synthase subunit A n=1 Tax=Borreliella garinii TaxID=29519 RepID=UPI00018E2622|nr:V-type ATP synthase subunit A [Borreliella garinii]EED30117.1 V-type ATP synthase alpha chain (V-type ATPase subunit A) [Borreliella garinii Far04]WNZ66336.1 V-type ATP synthase subunit A [Borreliella garinii]WNZ67332.1 V-type ATP synthase subunit A [Borreliella garinii]WNZ68329.1 V-type ATP synthase subunit A [Borreliella garinii]WNZ69329.1 V-type ATP synthase subunit A [Borreliella garinii]
MKTKGKVVGVNGNLVTIEVEGSVSMNEVLFIKTAGRNLKAEIIRVRGNEVDAQVFELAKGISVGDVVEFTDKLLTVELGPGLLTQVYDGLQNPLPELAIQCGFFLERGVYLRPLNKDKKWNFKKTAKVGDSVIAGDFLGFVIEGTVHHQIMIPFYKRDSYKIVEIVNDGNYSIDEQIAVIEDDSGMKHSITMSFHWPIKIPITNYKERLIPSEPMLTQTRIIDTFFPVAKGGTFCIPGPFGAGKTVLQQVTSRNADVDIVIIAACGERAGEVVETLKEFPELIDPKTGKSLMDRTCIICNTSSMPVAAREASVYTAITIGEYYRQMGLDILLLADSTSRWAQAMREMSGRLEEIPGEEAFPAYLESVIASFYERAGIVVLNNGDIGSVTVGGSVSPAGGNFEEPVTQATLKVVGAFHGLTRERSDARKFPAISPLESWSKYKGVIDSKKTEYARSFLVKGNEINQMMKVVGEEGISSEDFLIYLKSELLDSCYLQQNSFDSVDAAVSSERQNYMFDIVYNILKTNFEFSDKLQARDFMNELRQNLLDMNLSSFKDYKFNKLEQALGELVNLKKVI